MIVVEPSFEETKPIIEPRVRTPAPDARANTSSDRLPDDLLSEQVQRFGVFAAVCAGLWTFGLLMEAIVLPLTIGTAISRPSVVIDVLAIGGSALAFLYVRYTSGASQTKTGAGLWYLMLNAFAISAHNTWAAPVMKLGPLSWNGILILISSMIMPASPRKTLVASVAAASMDPLGVWIAHLRGMQVPTVVQTFLVFVPNYLCAVAATVPSHVFQRFARRLREAQEMGSYHLVERLGRGGMGEVWRARHRLLARNAAIKLIRPEVLGASGEHDTRVMLRRFEREAQATAALSSPHTIRIFDFGVTRDGIFYYVMELLAGRDLESLVREFGPLPADRTLFLLKQVCHSLADAHASGLVHRDIKPANIYLCRMGLDYDFVKVLDFGLVTFTDKSPGQSQMTADHMTTGTPAFMAPETIFGKGEVDTRADVYSLGCVVYFLLTGQLVFEADTTMKMFVDHLQTPPIPPSQRTELPIPVELDALVLACLEKDPNRRPQDAEQLLLMASQCQSLDGWNTSRARSWWETHLPELTGPITVAAPRSENVDPPVVIL